jgi:WD40 repeat protein
MSVAFSPDGRFLLSGSVDRTVRLWDAKSGVELAVMRGHDQGVTNVAFLPDGRHVISESWDKSVRLWDAQSGKCLDTLNGNGDIAAIAAGASLFPWRAMARNDETVVEPAAGGPPIAWYSDLLDHIATHREGRIWAGSVSSQHVLLQLEGG